MVLVKTRGPHDLGRNVQVFNTRFAYPKNHFYLFEAWEHMTDGGVQVDMPRPVSLAYVSRKFFVFEPNPPHGLTVTYAAH